MTPDTAPAPSEVLWTTAGLDVRLTIAAEAAVSIASLGPVGAAVGSPDAPASTRPPLVEVLALGHGRFPGSHRYADTELGRRLRYRRHQETTVDGLAALRVEQADPVTGLVVVSVLTATGAAPGLRAWTEVHHEGAETLTLQAVTSLVTGLRAELAVDDVDVLWADNDWVAESRWRRERLRDVGLPDIDVSVHAHASRSRFALTSRSSWSSGERLPTGVLTDRADGWALAWQVEHNGAWHVEVGETTAGAYLALMGPTDAEHQWHLTLEPGAAWTSVPVALAVADGGVDAALGALTLHRRELVRHVQGERLPATLPVIFNDYMNTLMGDPTTEKLLPLVDAAARVGADVFVVDAGWYDDDGSWWSSVGAWTPSTTRFPGGLDEVLERIRSHGMVAGLWLEPEVVGVRSPLADELPDEAFLQRGGQRFVEHGRHHLDLRSPAACAHLDRVVDDLVARGVGYFKLDYNIMAGAGSDRGGLAPGEGLLQHNRAHLRWLDRVLDRHPDLLLENCASGAMRMDYAMMSRLHVQSTSDQQNPLLYPHIAAAAPASLLPEQAGNWAYAQSAMSAEESAFTLAAGLAGRLYLSGYLNRMDDDQIALVSEAVVAHRALLPVVAESVPFWPLGLVAPADAEWTAVGLRTAGETLLVVWHQPGPTASVALPLPHLGGRQVRLETAFPVGLASWDARWSADDAVLHLDARHPGASARVLRLVPTAG